MNYSVTKDAYSANCIVPTYDATEELDAPFTVMLKDSVTVIRNAATGEVEDTIIPDPEGLVKAVARLRVLHPHKLGAADVKFLRCAIGMKAKDLAQVVSVTPEHMSRLESGRKVLSPDTEKILRVFVFVSTHEFTSRKEVTAAQVAETVVSVFQGLNIKACRAVDDALELVLTRVPEHITCEINDDGIWEDVA